MISERWNGPIGEGLPAHTRYITAEALGIAVLYRMNKWTERETKQKTDSILQNF
jgi:hypothetical protein